MTVSGLERVMVAGDSDEGLDSALAKAARIVGGTGAEILVLRTCYDPIVEESPDVLPPSQRTALQDALQRRASDALEALIRPYGGTPRMSVAAVWTAQAATTMVEEAARWAAQLLIKPVSPHHPVADYFHTPLDWALMRQAPCPVLVSKGDSWPPTGPVLAAVDAGDIEHVNLCHEILRQAHRLAAATDAELHVATAYPDLGQRLGELQVAHDFEGIKADMRESRERAVSGMLSELGISPASVHLVEGRPAPVIAELAAGLRVSVTVLGCAARGGVAKLIIGNTAEDLIGRLHKDLMTVREPWS